MKVIYGQHKKLPAGKTYWQKNLYFFHCLLDGERFNCLLNDSFFLLPSSGRNAFICFIL